MVDPKSDPNSFRVSWAVPIDLQKSTANIKLEYWKKAGEELAELKDKELAAGLDKNGSPLTPISQYTREHRKSEMGKAFAEAPPLTPAYGLSRTRSLLRWKPYLDCVVFYWDFDEHTGGSWGVILGYHRAGKGRLPKRDVIGVSRRAKAKAKAFADKWLSDRLAGKPEPLRTPARHQRPINRPFTPQPSVTPKNMPVKEFTSDWLTFSGGKFAKYRGPIYSTVAAGGLGVK